jgi:hypothetical protein
LRGGFSSGRMGVRNGKERTSMSMPTQERSDNGQAKAKLAAAMKQSTGIGWNIVGDDGIVMLPDKEGQRDHMIMRVDPTSAEPLAQQVSDELRRIAKFYIEAAHRNDYVNQEIDTRDPLPHDQAKLISKVSSGVKWLRDELDDVEHVGQVGAVLEHLDELAICLEVNAAGVRLTPKGKLPIEVYADSECVRMVYLDDPRKAWCRDYDALHADQEDMKAKVCNPNYAMPGIMVGTCDEEDKDVA